MDFLLRIRERYLEKCCAFESNRIQDGHYQSYEQHRRLLMSGRRLDLMTLLDVFANKKCADPRDRVYSLLSLPSLFSFDPSPISVDYTTSLNFLAYRVLSLGPERLCVCTAIIVLTALDPSLESPRRESISIRDGPWLEVDAELEYEAKYPNVDVGHIFGCKPGNYRSFPRELGLNETHAITKIDNSECKGALTLRVSFWRILSAVTGRIEVCNRGNSKSCAANRVRLGWGG